MRATKRTERPQQRHTNKFLPCSAQARQRTAFGLASVFFPTNKNSSILSAINMTTETRACIMGVASTGTEPGERCRLLSRKELQAMITGEPVSVCHECEPDVAPMASASAVTSTATQASSDAAPPPAPDSAMSDAPTPGVDATLTIAGLCKMIEAVGDLDAQVEAVSIVELVVMHFHLDAAGNRMQDGVRLTRRIDTTCLVAADFSGCVAISFVGKKPLSARTLLAALGPHVERYGDVRVCVRQGRAIERLRKTVALCTDSVLFKDDSTSITDAAKVCDIARAGEALIRLGEMSTERIAATLSGLMPRHWNQTYYCLDGALLPDLKAVYKRLPSIDKKALSELFVPAGKPSVSSLPGDGDHGNVVIWTLVPGLTYAALESAYGSSASKVNLLLSMARAAQATTPADANDATATAQ